ncbi:MAG TPA: hypothetical protein VMD75_07465 [Candidatus Binataceae bacterium]|nr:hypothetical protein [Candidatus Binataceae bacterium]
MTKIRLRVGEVEVEYEGPEAFLSKRMPSLLADLSKLSSQIPSAESKGKPQKKGESGDPGPLATYLNGKNAVKNQQRRFLATAQWLHDRGTERLKTVDVTKALQDSHQSRLGNPSDSLAKNVSKGHCEKLSKTEFHVTEEGRTSLG